MSEAEVNIPGYIPGQESNKKLPWLIIFIITILVIILPITIFFRDKSLRNLTITNQPYRPVDLIIRGEKIFIIERYNSNSFLIRQKEISSDKEISYKLEEKDIETCIVSEDGLKIYFTKENSPFLFFQELNSKNIISKINIVRPIEEKIIFDETSIFLCLGGNIQISPNNRSIAFNICNSKMKSKFIILNLEDSKLLYIGEGAFENSSFIFRWIDNNKILIYNVARQESKIIDLLEKNFN